MTRNPAADSTAGRRIAPLFPTVAASYLGYAMMGTLFVPMLMSPTDGYLPPDTTLAAPDHHHRVDPGALSARPVPRQSAARQPVRPLRPPPGRSSPRPPRRSCATSASRSRSPSRAWCCWRPFLLLCGLVEATLALTMSAVADVTNDDGAAPLHRLPLRHHEPGLRRRSAARRPDRGVRRLRAAVLDRARSLLVGVLIWLQFAFAETLPASARRATPLLRSLAGLSQVVTDHGSGGTTSATFSSSSPPSASGA